MTTRLSDIAAAIPHARLLDGANPIVDCVAWDSRQAGPGALFVAVRGLRLDGHRFIPQAVQAGAAAVAGVDHLAIEALPHSLGRMVVEDDRLAMALAADLAYGRPSRQLKLVGVTGTNGKSSTVHMLAAIMDAAGIPAASMGTLGLTVRGLNVPGDRTTPESPAIHAALRELVDSGVRGVAMEVSSHALSLQRTAGLMFDVALFTNLTQDHLDFYHGDMDEYFRAKSLLFMACESSDSCTSVINVDDPYGARLASDLRKPCLSFGMGLGCRLRAESLQVGPASVSFTARIDELSVQVAAPVGGRFNAYNLLGAVGASLALGIEPGAIERGLSGMAPVSGRFEAVRCGQSYTVLVDYAHTPDGLLNVLQSAREIASGKLHVVFGCGGDRDRGKRPLMGSIAAGLADEVVLTSDNSRSEEPAAIIAEILAGVPAGERGRVREAIDRRAAIQMALDACQAGDVLVIAGKGHEPYQIFADRTIHFDDREVVRELLKPGGAT